MLRGHGPSLGSHQWSIGFTLSSQIWVFTWAQSYRGLDLSISGVWQLWLASVKADCLAELTGAPNRPNTFLIACDYTAGGTCTGWLNAFGLILETNHSEWQSLWRREGNCRKTIIILHIVIMKNNVLLEPFKPSRQRINDWTGVHMSCCWKNGSFIANICENILFFNKCK